ncbi:acyl dehydratase [Kineobactrum sediminis]|uniref:Acyl dehydratase n=1 Tax=Kineobactrum sediminis TaxID=1905677 RepID=A0A2N5XY13_9GAMM|nr:MaoC/PaaZ C-terminal domain-containing protein [Kineobactrum sediminis]PLW81043.1 acyl dehydratase [Kineobactrum sediminis]
MTTNLATAELRVGALLPVSEIPVTTSLVTCGALATRDFEKVHHDKVFAQASGMPDVYMNILTTQGLTEAYLRDWCGPDAVFRKLSIRLGAPNIPGTTMTFSGTVKSCADGTVEVEVRGENSQWGTHVTALATIALVV